MSEIWEQEYAGSDPSDDLGEFWDLEVEGVTQRFRWVHPGTFLMGSPADEPGRFEDELQHEVTLTQGYWLGETAVTQALWRAVMGTNPSRFPSDDHPVEQVSWDDCQQFLDKLNRMAPGLEARLPTEAEWEYACRAGTTTPFSFGRNITPEQVNYHGDHPYNGGAKGLYRGETVQVKSLPSNPWGFYEMHGNVWEWCSDWYGDYPEKTVKDSDGTLLGSLHVIRGGCWGSIARGCRAAFRGENLSSDCGDGVGLRLARGCCHV